MKVAVILPAAGLGTRMGRTSAEKAGNSRNLSKIGGPTNKLTHYLDCLYESSRDSASRGAGHPHGADLRREGGNQPEAVHAARRRSHPAAFRAQVCRVRARR